jgi:cyclase
LGDGTPVESGLATLPANRRAPTRRPYPRSYGNFLFSGAAIVGHEATRTGILDWGKPTSTPFWTEVEWGDIVVEPPFLTYTDSVTLWADDLRADVRYVGVPAHTTNDSIVWLPERKLLFCGDVLFNGGTPFVAQGSVAGAIRTLEEVVRPRPLSCHA